jgi:hypothetical protein
MNFLFPPIQKNECTNACDATSEHFSSNCIKKNQYVQTSILEKNKSMPPGRREKYTTLVAYLVLKGTYRTTTTH